MDEHVRWKDGAGDAEGVPRGYTVLRRLEERSAGPVYLARQEGSGREVLLEVRAAQQGVPGPEALAVIRHPAVAEVLEVGTGPAGPYLVREYCPGVSLEDRLRTGPLEPLEAARLLHGIAEGLQAIHEAGSLHLDLHAGGIRQAADGRWKLASLPTGTPGGEPQGTRQPTGRPAYLAPEQAEGRPTGPPADVWSLGVILYQCLVGKLPFLGESAAETLDQAVHLHPRPPRHVRPEIPYKLEVICLNCLDKTPAVRYPTARAVANALAKFLEHPEDPPASRRHWHFATLAVVGTVLLLAWIGVRQGWWTSPLAPRAAPPAHHSPGSEKGADRDGAGPGPGRD